MFNGTLALKRHFWSSLNFREAFIFDDFVVESSHFVGGGELPIHSDDHLFQPHDLHPVVMFVLLKYLSWYEVRSFDYLLNLCLLLNQNNGSFMPVFPLFCLRRKNPPLLFSIKSFFPIQCYKLLSCLEILKFPPNAFSIFVGTEVFHIQGMVFLFKYLPILCLFLYDN